MNLQRRLKEHNNGNSYFTNRIGKKLFIGYFEFESKDEAINLEREIKKSGHIERYISKENFIKFTG